MSAIKSFSGSDWRSDYLLAIQEADRGKLPARIAKAQKVIVARARELFDIPGDNIEEGHALDDALYALQALKSCLIFHTN
jgi:hypothetical protein